MPSTRPPAAAPAAARWRSSAAGARSRPASRRRPALRAAPPEAAPARHRRQAHAPQRRRLHEAALVGELRLRAACSSARSAAGVGRRAGSMSSASSMASQSSSGRSRRSAGERGQRPAEAARGGGRAAGAHRVGAGPGLVERERERVDVAGGRHAGALGLLGRHVGQRADHVARARERVAGGHVRHPEVGQLRESSARGGLREHHHVLGLDVAVDHPARVRVLEGLAERGSDARDVAVRNRARMHQLGKRSAPNQLRDEIHVVLVRGQLVDGHDARVVQPRCGARLALDPLTGPAVARNRLHGHLALELLVPGQPYHPEPARAQAPLQAVAAQDHAGRRHCQGAVV